MKKTLIKTFTGVMAVTAVVGAMAITSNAAEVPEQMTSETTASVETVAEVQDANPFHRLNRQAHDMVARYNAMGQGDVIDDQFVVDEGWGDVIDDQFVYVEGQGDVIDDQFVYVEGQGDVIDDQFVYVEGQGDVIDDQFAVASADEEHKDIVIDMDAANSEVVVAATAVAENTLGDSMPAPIVLGQAGFFGPSEHDDEIQDGYNQVTVKEEDKSVVSTTLEVINKLVDPTTLVSEQIGKGIDEQKDVGVAEKVVEKELVKNGLSTAFGSAVPGAGTAKKALKAAECFSNAVDNPSTMGKVANIVEGFKNGVEAAICTMPGGGLIVAGVEGAVSVLKYGVTKLVFWN